MASWERAEWKQRRPNEPKKRKIDDVGVEDKKVRPQRKKWSQQEIEKMDMDESWDDGEFD